MGGDIAVHEHRIQGIAHRGALHLGIKHDLYRPIQPGRGLDVQVADADPARDHRDGGVLARQVVQPWAAARDDHVNVLVQAQHLHHQLPVGRRDPLQRALGQPCLGIDPLHDVHQRTVAVERLAAAAQNDGIARFQAQRRNVNGHVGP